LGVYNRDLSKLVKGNYGILVPNSNEEEFVKAINIFLKDKNYYNLVKSNSKKRVEFYSSQNIISKFEEEVLQ